MTYQIPTLATPSMLWGRSMWLSVESANRSSRRAAVLSKRDIVGARVAARLPHTHSTLEAIIRWKR
jgi:hypothetical protein